MATFFLAIYALLSVSLPANLPKFVDERDGNQYDLVELNGLQWFAENLRLKTENSTAVSDSALSCGEFYVVDDAFKVCPDGWRLPTETEVKRLIKHNKRGKINLSDTLNINLCGRIDAERHSRMGEQNTYWIDAELKGGYIMHWHTFGDRQELHNHNVVNSRRQFPVRCVCEIAQ